jgi:hypothetical protein
MAISTPVQAWDTPYLNGMHLSYASTTTITVDAGTATNGNFVAANGTPPNNIITLETAVTINAALSGAGGVDQGAIAANTKYYVYAIGNSNSYAPGINDQMVYTNPYPGSALISTSLTPILPLGYNMYRYIGTVFTNGSSQFVQFYQTGRSVDRTMYYDAAVATAITAGTSTTYANVSLAASVPFPNLKVLLRVSLTPNTAASQTSVAPFGSTSTNGVALVKGQVAAVANPIVVECPCTSNAGVPTVLYKTTSASDSVAISVAGYVDEL